MGLKINPTAELLNETGTTGAPDGASKARTAHRNNIQIGLALLFLILGTGNIFFGLQRKQEYVSLLSKADSELTSPQGVSTLPFLSPAVNIDQQTRHIHKLHARIDFYNIVILGGQVFLVIGIFLLILGYVSIRYARAPSEEGDNLAKS